MSLPLPMAVPSLDASYRYCQRLARRTAKNFYYAFLTLPADVRRDMCALYSYMRVCDDLGDDERLPLPARRAALADWRTAVVEALEAGVATHPVLPALTDVARRRGIPAEALLDVITGVEMDLSPVRYESFEALTDYCYHVAGAVGVCCIHVWGFDGETARQRAIECGLAFQLTNILRDLAEDARMGRLYLPAEDLERFRYQPAELAAGVVDDRFRELMSFQVARARDYYKRSAPLAELLRPTGRPVFTAMWRIYSGLLDEIERRNYDVFRGRVTLPPWKKLAIAATAMLRC
jgi:phytoene synthase